MLSSSSSSMTLNLLDCFFVVLIQLFFLSHGRPLSTEHQHYSSSTSSLNTILVFGDSTVDPGNNNYIPTLFRSNFPPYGRDFLDHQPTGRFTNGRLTTDYIGNFNSLPQFKMYSNFFPSLYLLFPKINYFEFNFVMCYCFV